MTRTIHIRVTGHVQGIGYRAFVEREAVARGLSGWVRNCRDGSVEAVFSGPQATVDRMVAVCWQGPRPGSVEHVEVLPDEAPPASGPFIIAPSA